MSESDVIYPSLNIKGAAISGIWNGFQFNSRLKTILYKCYGTMLFIIFLCFNTSQFIEMFNVITNLPLLVQNVNVTLLYVVVVVKVGTMHFRSKRIQPLLDRIRNEEKRAFTRSKEELKLYYETVQHNVFMTKWFWRLCLCTWAGFFIARPTEYWVLGPQQINHFKMPFLFSSWFPFDRYAPRYHYWAHAFQMLCGTIGAYYTAVSDTFYVGFIIFGIGQYRMIQCAITNLHTCIANKYSATNENDLSEIDVYEEIIDIIKHHCRIIEYYEDLEDLITPVIFLQFLLTSMMICAAGLEGIMSGLSVRLVLSLEYLVLLLIELFNYYWHANEVSLESGNVGKAVAESKWYRFSPRVKQALIILMLRSEKPSTLTVGGFYSMSLNTYVMILRATYSFLALFRTMYARDDKV